MTPRSATRYWPLGEGRIVTSPYGPRSGGYHYGTDFGRNGGSANMPVYAAAGGTVLYAGSAQGYGGPDPAGWVVIDHPTADGGGCTEYGHIIREVSVGQRVEAGQRIARINPDSRTNGGTAPHLHMSVMPREYNPGAKIDPVPWLGAAREPGEVVVPPPPPPGGGYVPSWKGWTGDPVWLEEVLRPDLGDRLKVLDGWQYRGHGDFKDIRGVMMHHTGNSRETAQSIAQGRPDLPGPLSNIHIAPDGTVTIVAVGVCWHAGAGSWPWLPTNQGNWHLIGIECAWPDIAPDGSYNPNQRWPDAQIISMRDTAAALTRKLGFPVDRVITHKEYAGPAQGKWDPGNFDPGWFRGEVQKDLDGYQFPGEGPPPVEPPPELGDGWLCRGMAGPMVTLTQVRLKRLYSKLDIDGNFGEHTERCVLDYQSLRPALRPTGVVDDATARALLIDLHAVYVPIDLLDLRL